MVLLLSDNYGDKKLLIPHGELEISTKYEPHKNQEVKINLEKIKRPPVFAIDGSPTSTIESRQYTYGMVVLGLSSCTYSISISGSFHRDYRNRICYANTTVGEMLVVQTV